jgi:hypothetical protein
MHGAQMCEARTPVRGDGERGPASSLHHGEQRDTAQVDLLDLEGCCP